MLDSLQNLHAKYQAEDPQGHMSYALFCRLRPFNVVHPRARDKQTCLCQKCENGELMVEKLIQHKVLSKGTTLDTCSKMLCCDPSSQDCYDRKCEGCKNNLVCSTSDANSESKVSTFPLSDISE